MKHFLLITILFFSIPALCQKTKKIDVYRNHAITIVGSISYNEDNTPSDTIYYAFGLDHRYTYLTSLTNMQAGTLKELYDFFIYTDSFLKNEDEGVTETYSNCRLSIFKYAGIKQIWIYGMDEDGYTTFSGNQLLKIATKIKDWATKNNVSI